VEKSGKPLIKERKMVKKIVLGLFVMVVIAGAAGAQETAWALNTGNTFGFGINSSFMALGQPSIFGTRANIDLFADSGSSGFMTENRFVAGLLNMPLGFWSWMNKDWLGGGITAGLMAGGIACMVYGMSQDSGDSEGPIGEGLGTALLGAGMVIASPIFGFFRGLSYSKRLQASSLAEAISDNPMNHISLIVLPTFDERKAIGAFTYSLSY
jgi:hypothetical protein